MSHIKNLNTPDDDATEVDATPWISRRALLRASGILAGVGALGYAAFALTKRQVAEGVRALVNIPSPSDPAPAIPAAATPSVAGIPPVVTPVDTFFRIDTSMSPPVVDVATWKMSLHGRVDNPLTLTYEDLLGMPSIERYVTLSCVSNDIGGDLIGTQKFQGVRLSDLLDKVGVHSDASLILGESVDNFTAGFPTDFLKQSPDAMVAYAMNGAALPTEHGFPARLVVPGLYGYVSATKWLSGIKLTTLNDDPPYWVTKGWLADGVIQGASRIDVPRQGTTVKAGTVGIGGRAWTEIGGVKSVEVKIDEGQWQPATLAAPIAANTWRLWSYAWAAEAGDHTIAVRMTNDNGTEQTDVQHGVYPGAASGLHTISVAVA
ncbi:MAG: molybdopterin-dependent oxidoreductase [Actinomycetes bacterium]